MIDDARDAARSFSSDLPNFLVQQVTTRYQGSRYVDNWKSVDVVTADVASVNGKEDYRNIKVNGRPTTRPEDTGAWSTGELPVTLDDILSPMTAAEFKLMAKIGSAIAPRWFTRSAWSSRTRTGS